MDFEEEYTNKGASFVFGHGLGASPQQVKELLGHRKVLLMECPGHGNSILTTTPSFAYYSERVIQLLDSLKIDKALVGGISMGSGIALHMALNFPDRVKGLVLVRPAWLDQAAPENLAILLEAAKAIREGEKQKFFEGGSFKRLEKVSPNAAKSVMGLFQDQQKGPRGISFVLENLVHDKPVDNLEKLTKINVPCLIIGNEDDPLHPLAMAQEIHKKINGSTFEIVPSRYINDQKHGESVRHLISKFIKKHEKHLD